MQAYSSINSSKFSRVINGGISLLLFKRNLQLEEATLLVRKYEEVYDKRPSKELLREFFWLFESRDAQLNETFQDVFRLDDNAERSQQAFIRSEPMFEDYEAFLEYVESDPQ